MAGTLHLGLAMWANADWRGTLYGRYAEPSDSLPDYGRVFSCVEGNTTFYSGAPREDVVATWARQAPEHFRFCFKLPSRLTHDQRLVGIEDEMDQFFERLAPLHDRLGPTMIQLPRDFGADELPMLEAVLKRWPTSLPCAVEVRHSEFFHKGTAEQSLNRLLITHGADRVMLDARALFATPAGDDTRLQQAQREKPRRPLHVLSTATQPVVRFIGHFDDAINHERFTPWIEQMALWMEQEKSPVLFVHTPDNRAAPILARAFHARLAERIALPALADFAGERQESLF
ncbi:Uncharacterized conserved protein YecE, DUF72 family [Kushneria avicenniae]|uniref:Uncharacterized conserved protein YecE, DUF72 family n=2 Tax=Kushneria avicenniae TaxID=402385 RepID=A0A1I1JUG1_9GAMM|nr:DUF72 domain-containing protein [Kushneria avicenniae]SFC51602.1 Uncharacterized conserved protein YecE, DUF72 family [Kushneria avicenniae]